jgi:cytochrome P450
MVYFKGSDTTSTLLCNVIYRLTQHRDVLQELLIQIQETASPSEINFSTVKKMPYLTAVLEECLRMLPPVPNVFPRVVPPEGATICGHFVPGGSVVGVNQLSANMSSKHFSLPDSFLPTRWLGGDEFSNDNRRARKPFSYGPRNCAGQK